LKPPVVAEHPIQKQVCDLLTLELAAPGRLSPFGVVWFSIDHADYAGAVPGIRVGRGIIAGVLDLFFLWHGLAGFIELKTVVGVVSDAQRSMCAAMLGAGGRVGVACDAAGVLTCLDTWGVPRARRCVL
jgi:hypothetical protein